MPGKSRRTPAYRLHKPSGQARVIIAGQHIYLGRYESAESQEKYHRLVAEWLAAQKRPTGAGNGNTRPLAPTVNELILAFWEHARQRYVENGTPTSEIRSFRTALRPVRQLYGREPVTSFGPLALVACRLKLIEAGICRKRINQHVGRIRQMFKWGVARELVPETVWRALLAVEGLRFGEAPEKPPVKPVPEANVEAIKPSVTPQVAAMIDLQLWSGCRPGEACVMRAADINTQGAIWEYRPHSHKGQHHQKERIVYLGPRAQEVIKPWLKMDLHAYLFSPQEARAWYQAQRAAHRKTPKQFRSQPYQPKANPQRKPRDRYTNQAYCRAIQRACERAGVPVWSPGQLRHNAGTRIRSAYGIEATRVILGHASVTTSQIYGEADQEKAREIMGKLG